MTDGPTRGEEAYRRAVLGFSLIFLAVGILVMAVTLANGGGPASVGFLMGLAFLAIGGARIWLGSRR